MGFFTLGISHFTLAHCPPVQYLLTTGYMPGLLMGTVFLPPGVKKLFPPHSIQNKDLSPTIICSGCTFTSNPYTFAAIMSKQIQWLSRSLLFIQRPLQVDPATETIDSWGKIHLLVERMQLIMNCKVHLVLRYLLNSQCRCSANVKSLVFEIISVWTHMVKEST